MAQIDHEEGKVDGIGDSGLFHIHKIIQTPILFGVTEVELDLEAECIEVNYLLVIQCQVGAEQQDMSLSASGEIGF